MTESAIITVQQGKKRLERLESVAAGRFMRSSESFDQGIQALQRIRDQGVWHYAKDADGVMLGDYKKPRWEDYIRSFCDRHGVGRSTTFAALNVVDTWNALGLPRKTLEEVGLEKAKEIRHLVKYDGRSRQLKLPPPEVLEKLPPGKDPVDQIREKVKEVLIDPPEPLTHHDVRDAFSIDTGVGEDVYVWVTEGNRVRYTYEGDSHLADGVLIGRKEWEGLDEKFREWLNRRLKIAEREG